MPILINKGEYMANDRQNRPCNTSGSKAQHYSQQADPACLYKCGGGKEPDEAGKGHNRRWQQYLLANCQCGKIPDKRNQNYTQIQNREGFWNPLQNKRCNENHAVLQ